MKLHLFIYGVFLSHLVLAQDIQKKHIVGIQWEAPVQYGVKYEYLVFERFSAGVQLGLMMEPNSTLILNMLDLLGVDQDVVDLTESAFQYGLVIEEDFNYHFGKNSLGILTQQILLTGEDTPYTIVEKVLEEDLNSYPNKRNRSRTNETSLTLKSNLFQLGLQYGRTFPLKNYMQLFTEIGVSMNIGSRSSLHSENKDLTALNVELDAYLDDIYKTYSYIPSVTFGFSKWF